MIAREDILYVFYCKFSADEESSWTFGVRDVHNKKYDDLRMVDVDDAIKELIRTIYSRKCLADVIETIKKETGFYEPEPEVKMVYRDVNNLDEFDFDSL